MCDIYPNVVVSLLKMDHSCGAELIQESCVDSDHLDSQDDIVIFKFGRQFSVKRGQSIDDYSMFYIGQEGLTLTNFMMTWNHCAFSSFNPETCTGRVESVKINKALMKRYYAIERAKDASVVGVLVGTLGVANYLTIIEQLKDIIHKAGKKSYMFAMGKINVPKLANFLEIDVYVLVACPENSLLDSSEFYRPVVTPFEMELACNKQREWTGEYVTDFRDLLPGMILRHFNKSYYRAIEKHCDIDIMLLKMFILITWALSDVSVHIWYHSEHLIRNLYYRWKQPCGFP